MLVKTAIVGEVILCDKCGHCHELESPCLFETPVEKIKTEEIIDQKKGQND